MMEIPHAEAAARLLPAVAVALAAAYAPWRASARGLDAGAAYRATLAAALAALLAGHLLFAATHGSAFAGLAFASGGQSVFGVLAGGALAAGAYLAWRRLPLLEYGDLAVPGVALGYAVARVGCFVNGDDFGALSALPWAVRYPPGTEAWAAHAAEGWIGPDAPLSLAIHPVQLYLAAAGAAVFLLLHGRRLPPGAALGVAALGYGAARFLAEPLRADFRAFAGPASLPQLFSLALAAAGAGLLARAWLRASATDVRPSPAGAA